VIILKYFFEAQILNIHDLHTNLNFCLQMYFHCIVFFDIRNLVLCLTRELIIKFIDYKIMLKLQCKTTFYSAFVGKIIIKIEQESTLE
jgi:hypothetical protein